MWDQIKELKPMPIPVPADKVRCAIEERFPHIARELCALWETDRIELYLDDLLLDTRGGRQGFPVDVLDELMFLSGMRWHIRHETARVQDLLKPAVFTFAAANEADIPQSRSSHAWVL